MANYKSRKSKNAGRDDLRGWSLILTIIIVTMLLLLVFWSSGQCGGILGTTYEWSDSVYTSTTHIDSLFDERWEYVIIWADSGAFWLRTGSSSSGIDTASWSVRVPKYIPAGSKISIGPEIKLRRAEWWMVAGAGTIYFWGYKRGAQY